jgi:hypothetical protein
VFADWRVTLLAVMAHFSVLGTRINEILDVSASKGVTKPDTTIIRDSPLVTS